MGHKVFSPNGAYENPGMPGDPKRPALPTNLEPAELQQLMDVARQGDRSSLHPELVKWADVVIVMHKPEWVVGNVGKGKPVVWRTIGQSISSTEGMLRDARNQGLKIVRYSPKEKNIPGFIGEDAVIRFYKDPEEYEKWSGHRAVVINFTQSMPGRGPSCHFDTFKEVCGETHSVRKDVFPILPAYLYGPGNEDSGFPGESVPYEKQKELLKDCRAYFYTGTEPASYTLNGIEALMSGIPVVSLGKKLGNTLYDQDTYEMGDIIEDGVSGFVSDEPRVIRARLEELLTDRELATRISEAGKARAVELFGKEKIKEQWGNFLGSL